MNWCLVEKMDQQLRPPHIPKYTDQEAQEYAMKHLAKQLVSDTADVKFRDFWERRESFALVALEEGHLEHWSWGRIVCAGDSVHKVGTRAIGPCTILNATPQVTPESGQGANQAMESAAALANHIERMLHNCTEKVPDLAAIRKCLASFEAKRRARSKPVVQETNLHVRLFTYTNTLLEFLAKYVQPIFFDIAANKSNDRHIGAERVDFLPVPSRSVSGIMMFNPTQGIGLFESWTNRAFLGLPLLMIGFLGSWWTEQNLVNMIQHPVGVNGPLNVSNASSAERSSDLWSSDELKLVYQYQLRLFLIDIAPLYLIWLMEANRRANYLKPIQMYVKPQTRPVRLEGIPD